MKGRQPLIRLMNADWKPKPCMPERGEKVALWFVV
jgi:hypothetical protein